MRGGKREGAGRPKGAPNKIRASLRDKAREYTDEALEALLAVVRDGESETARVSAANAILDRGYGKPTQPLSGDDDMDPLRVVAQAAEWTIVDT